LTRHNPLRDDAYRDYIRSNPCAIAVRLSSFAECLFKVQCCHVKHAGMGGTYVPDHGNLWPGCGGHHQEQHNSGVDTFQRKYDINLCDVARRMEEGYKEN